MRYLILIRELLKDTQNEIPDYLEEAIYYLGQAYNLFCQETNTTLLFNGNHDINNKELDEYLKINGYKFKSHNNELAGYVYFKNKSTSLIVDVGTPPEKKFSQSYQSGTLSFEFTYQKKKIITNCGYFQKNKHQLNSVSRSTAAHSALIIDNSSITRFSRDISGKVFSDNNFKIIGKKFINEGKKWAVEASHDGYLKLYGIIHKRRLEYFTDKFILKGTDILIKKKNFKSSNFEIRFHLMPGSKIIKTTDCKNILIEIENTGWKFSCNENIIDFETGLYFGKKNKYIESQNIYISGITNNKDQKIMWELEKI